MLQQPRTALPAVPCGEVGEGRAAHAFQQPFSADQALELCAGQAVSMAAFLRIYFQP